MKIYCLKMRLLIYKRFSREEVKSDIAEKTNISRKIVSNKAEEDIILQDVTYFCLVTTDFMESGSQLQIS